MVSIFGWIFEKEFDFWIWWEQVFVECCVFRFVRVVHRDVTLECVAFVLRTRREWSFPFIWVYDNVCSNLKVGWCLFYEIFEGLWSIYYFVIDNLEVLVFIVCQFIVGQQIGFQCKVKKEWVVVEFDFCCYDLVCFYLYVFVEGMK